MQSRSSVELKVKACVGAADYTLLLSNRSLFFQEQVNGQKWNDEDAVTGSQERNRGTTASHLNKKRILPPFLRNLLPKMVFYRKVEN